MIARVGDLLLSVVMGVLLLVFLPFLDDDQLGRDGYDL